MSGTHERGLLDHSPEEAVAEFERRGGRAFHAKIARREVLGKGVLEYRSMTSLPAELRAQLAEEIPLLTAEECERRRTDDGTTKLLLRFPDGASVETVHIPSRRRDRAATLCVSTQVGCPVGCPFCASGLAGLQRNLSTGEILEQFVRGRHLGPLSRAVIMGIGEPLLNWKNLAPALRVVNDEMGLGARRVTLSTVGFPERLAKIAPEKPPFQLAISLHSPFDAERAELVPAMKDVPVEDVLQAGDHWFETTGREVTYEYVLLGGLNDTPRHALALVEKLRRRRCTLNLIPWNPLGDERWQRPTQAQVEAFQAELQAGGLVATVRWSRGVEADAACGQLRIRHEPGSVLE